MSLLRADDHRLGPAIAACAGGAIDVRGRAAGAIGAGHDLARPAPGLSWTADHPEARAGARRTLRTGRPCRTLRTGWPDAPWRSGRPGRARRPRRSGMPK